MHATKMQFGLKKLRKLAENSSALLGRERHCFRTRQVSVLFSSTVYHIHIITLAMNIILNSFTNLLCMRFCLLGIHMGSMPSWL